MPVQLIKRPSRSGGPASRFIGKASPGLRNSLRGLRCEELVLKYYQKNNYTLVHRRWKTAFAEVDLLLLNPENRYVMVEVKSLHSTDFLPHRLSWKQKARLQKVIESFSSKNLSICFHLAVVNKVDQVLIFDSIFG